MGGLLVLTLLLLSPVLAQADTSPSCAMFPNFACAAGDIYSGTHNFSGATLTGEASTATALAANGANCSAGEYAQGVDASGAAEGCTTAASGDITAVGDCTTGACFQSETATECLCGPGGGGIAAFRALADADIPDTITIDLAATATALAADPTDCSANQFANAIAASGNLTCAAIVDADVPDSITIDLAATATALAADPSDCSANQFANAIAASGNLSCAAIADADVPDSITIDLAATATALAADPTDCSANEFANAIAASGNLTCAAIADADVPDSITIDLAATATALAADPTDCSANEFANAIAASGNLSCDALAVADMPTAIKTFNKNFAIYQPDATNHDAVVQIVPHANVTLTEVRCSTDTGTVTIQFDERAEGTPNTGGTDVMTAQLVCDNDSQSTDAFDNAGITADAILSMDIDATASSPTMVRVHVRGTLD